MKQEPILIIFASDKGFLRHTFVAVASLLVNLAESREAEIVLLTDEAGKDAAECLGELTVIHPFRYRITVMEPDLFEGFPPWNGSMLPYARILIPRMFPDRDRALYLDSDVIVEGDVSELWDTPLSGKLLGAVPDSMQSAEHLASIGLPPGTPYLNTGVLLMDLDRMRKESFPEEIMALKREFPDDVFVDQDPMNRLLKGDFKQLPPEWNSLWKNTLDLRPRLPEILHYGGFYVKMHRKAWHFPGADRYFHYEKLLPFPAENTPMDLRSFLFMLTPFRMIRPVSRFLACTGLRPLYRFLTGRRYS